LKVPTKYISVLRVNNSPFGQLVISRLRSEGVDFRIRNDNVSAIYQLDTLGMEIEVNSEQMEIAKAIIAEMELSGSNPNFEINHIEADQLDIEFEKQMQEREQKIVEAKPPFLIFFFLFLFLIISYLIVTFI